MIVLKRGQNDAHQKLKCTDRGTRTLYCRGLKNYQHCGSMGNIAVVSNTADIHQNDDGTHLGLYSSHLQENPHLKDSINRGPKYGPCYNHSQKEPLDV